MLKPKPSELKPDHSDAKALSFSPKAMAFAAKALALELKHALLKLKRCFLGRDPDPEFWLPNPQFWHPDPGSWRLDPGSLAPRSRILGSRTEIQHFLCIFIGFWDLGPRPRIPRSQKSQPPNELPHICRYICAESSWDVCTFAFPRSESGNPCSRML